MIANLLVAVVPANINPLPAIVSRNLCPAGVITVIVDRTTKAEREEIAVVEPMVEMIMEVVMAPCRASAPALNTQECRDH